MLVEAVYVWWVYGRACMSGAGGVLKCWCWQRCEEFSCRRRCRRRGCVRAMGYTPVDCLIFGLQHVPWELEVPPTPLRRRAVFRYQLCCTPGLPQLSWWSAAGLQARGPRGDHAFVCGASGRTTCFQRRTQKRTLAPLNVHLRELSEALLSERLGTNPLMYQDANACRSGLMSAPSSI